MAPKPFLFAAILTSIFLLGTTTAAAYQVCPVTPHPTVTPACTPQAPSYPSKPCSTSKPKCPETPWASYPPCSRFAVLPGFYLGGQIGFSELHYTPSSLKYGTAHINNDGTGGRVYFGYQLNPYWGGEAGYTYFALTRVDQANGQPLSGTIQHQAYDVVLKGTYPLVDSGFNVYAKAGGAYVTRSVSPIIAGIGNINGNLLFVYGAGLSYNFTRHIPIEVSWTRVEHNKAIPDSDLAAVGIAYYFG